MKFTIIEHEQRSPAWFAARLGRLTGSKADCVLAKGRGASESVTRRDYRMQLAAEILSSAIQEDGFTNSAMVWGIEQEPHALLAYEARTGDIVRRTGFLCADGLRVGCSLDGDIDDFAGIIEIKCPKTSTHLGYLRTGVVPPNYMAQIRHNLWVSGAQWADFVSFDPRLPQELRLFVVRVQAQMADIQGYQTEALNFLMEVEAEVKAINAMRSAA